MQDNKNGKDETRGQLYRTLSTRSRKERLRAVFFLSGLLTTNKILNSRWLKEKREKELKALFSSAIRMKNVSLVQNEKWQCNICYFLKCEKAHFEQKN